jgi:hypothetical protein
MEREVPVSGLGGLLGPLPLAGDRPMAPVPYLDPAAPDPGEGLEGP